MRAVNFEAPAGPDDFARWAEEALREIERASRDPAPYQDIQSVSATSRLLGRKSAGPGVIEELTLSEALDFIGSAAQGDILYRGASTWARLPAGTSGYVLSTLGASANPLWVPRREILTAARSYYTRADGSDSNTGLANTAGGAFLTAQKLADTIGSLDMSTYQVTGEIADGTYTGAVTLPRYLGALAPIIKGNLAAPGNVIISPTGATCFRNDGAGTWHIRDMELRSTTSGNGFFATDYGAILFQNIRFGACANLHMFASGGRIKCTAGQSYSITGGAQAHMAAVAGSVSINDGVTVTVSGTPAFSDVFVRAGRQGLIEAYGSTITGSATGKRFDAQANGVIFTAGGGADFFPGSSAGTEQSGGQYI